MGVIVDNKKQNTLNVLPDLDIQLPTSSLECSKTEQLPIKGNMQETQVMIDMHVKERTKLYENGETTQMVRNYGK